MTATTLGHYRLESEIGSGAMGAVYRAVDTRLHRTVAIKLWRHGAVASEDAARRMLREARAASALNHPNIVIVHDFGETSDGDPFIVQELIHGRTLRDRMSRPIPLADVADIGTQVARALDAAHTAGIVHRDIKPENVMLRSDGYVKVLDFGIAHLPPLAADADGSLFETLSNDLIGTPAYMSPEVMLGGTIGPPADVFALGVTLYEMVTGQLPFAAATPMAVLARIMRDTPAPMTSLDPALSPALDSLVQAMLDKSPEQRPTAADVAAALPALARPVEPEIEPRVESATLTVGRDVELAQLMELYGRVAGGRSVVAGVSGEAGIGKSTLLEAFTAALPGARERPMVVKARCSENLSGSEAYLPVLDALDALRTRGLDGVLRSVAPTWHSQLTPPPADAPNDGAAPSQERMKRELRAFLREASRQAPVVWLIEDLHWADASTVDILNYVAERFDELRVMIVVAFRPSDMSLARHPFRTSRAHLQSKGVYAEVRLSFLSRADVASFLALRWPSNAFGESFIDEIHSRTEGSPLFMVDLVRYLHDTGTIVDVDGVWTVTSARTNGSHDLPESVRGMIARKIERVDDADRKLLLAACVQGAEFESAIVAEALELDAADVEERLEALQSVHALIRRGEEVEYPDASLTLRYRFVHILYQNVLYASLSPARRVALCGAAARALAAHSAADAAPAAVRLGVLFEAARDFGTAGQYFFVAAQRAVSLFGYREALTLAERGLDGVSKLPPGPSRVQLELALQMTRGLALRLVRGWAAPELEPTLSRARQLCQQLDDPPELFPVMWNLAFFNMIRGNLSLVHEQIHTLDTQAGAAHESAYRMAACHIAGVTCEFTGDVRRASELLEEARELHDPARHPQYSAMFGMDPGMIARAMSSRPLWALGYPDRALARSQETIELSRSQRQPVTYTFALIVAQGIHLYRGELDAAIELGDQIVALCQEYEFAQEVEWGRAFQGAAHAAAGQVDAGVAQLEASLAAMAALRSGLVRTMFLSLLADAYRRAGRLEDGFRIVDEGFAYADKSLEHGFGHELHRVRGELLMCGGRLADAEASLREALAFASRHDARSFELRAATSLGRLLLATSRVADARATLGPVLEKFGEGEGTADLRSARSILDEAMG